MTDREKVARLADVLNRCAAVVNALNPKDPTKVELAHKDIWDALEEVSEEWPISTDTLLALLGGERPVVEKAGDWKIVHRFERHVNCPNCDYMGVEICNVKGTTNTGICTKCGHTWESDARPPEWFMKFFQRPATDAHEVEQ